MKKIKGIFTIILMGVLSTFLSGCLGDLTHSINPFYTEEYKTEPAELLGVWDVVEAPDTATTLAGVKTWYFDENVVMIFEKDASISILSAVYFKIDDTLFLDLSAFGFGYSIGENWAEHVLPSHDIQKITFSKDGLFLTRLDDDWLKKRIEEGTADLSHQKSAGNDYIFTTSSEDWISFLKGYKDIEGAFPENLTMNLQRNPIKEKFMALFEAIEEQEVSAESSEPLDLETYEQMVNLGEPILPMVISLMKLSVLNSSAPRELKLWSVVRDITDVDLCDNPKLSDQEMAFRYVLWWQNKQKEVP